MKNIKRLAAYYSKKFDTRNPFEIADSLGILYQIGNIGCSGCYMYIKKHRYIFLNQNLTEFEQKLVMAHELGHAVLHRTQNCYFIRHKTLFSIDKLELEANKFAVELLISDEMLNEYQEFTTEQLSKLFGYHIKLIELRLK